MSRTRPTGIPAQRRCIIGGNHHLIDEGYFDCGTLFDCWRRSI